MRQYCWRATGHNYPVSRYLLAWLHFYSVINLNTVLTVSELGKWQRNFQIFAQTDTFTGILFSTKKCLLLIDLKMFKIFGGKSKEQAPTTQEAIQKLRSTEEMLTKKSEFLEKKIDNEVETARKFAAKNKRGKKNGNVFYGGGLVAEF